MFCVQCGFEIEDGFNFCPKCGTKVVFVQPEQEHRVVAPEQDPVGGYEFCSDDMNQKRKFTNEEMNDIAEELHLKYPQKRVKAVKEFRMITGADLKTAKEMIDFHFESEPQYKKDDYTQSLADAFNQSSLDRKAKRDMKKIPHCPRCKSTAISYGQKPSWSRALLGYSVAGDAGAVIGSMTGKKGYAVCLKCGKTWKI